MRWNALLGIAVYACLAVGLASPTAADGTETLGVPLGLTLEQGTGIVGAGVGTRQLSGGVIDVEVPLGATVKQVVAYWGGEVVGNVLGDATLTFGGTAVTGDSIGGPAFFFADGGDDVYYSAFRADITFLNLVGAGPNMVVVDDMNFPGDNNGVGLLVIYEEAVGSGSVDLRDGIDIAFDLFPEPRKTTTPQTFDIPAATVDRTVTLILFVGGVAEDRPNVLEVTVDGETTTEIQPFNSNDGSAWDTLNLPVSVPANIGNPQSMITVMPISRDDTGSGVLVASPVWLAAALAVQSFCGDLKVDEELGETCDPAGEQQANGNPCRDDCTYCGDGNVDDGEACDPGSDPDCPLDCSSSEPFCGDGRVEADLGETCDPPGEVQPSGSECRSDCTFCGDWVRDATEECDDGNGGGGDGCGPSCEIEPSCGPGYWKQRHHLGNWASYSTSTSYGTVFGVSPSFGDHTLLRALFNRGGGELALSRHAVAALLNAASPTFDFYYGESEVIAIVQTAYASGNFRSAKAALSLANSGACPLGRRK